MVYIPELQNSKANVAFIVEKDGTSVMFMHREIISL
jgi:hypothetical protein